MDKSNRDVQGAEVENFLRSLQQEIVEKLSAIEGRPFLRDAWERAEGGGGISQVLEGGEVFERAGVNFSHVR